MRNRQDAVKAKGLAVEVRDGKFEQAFRQFNKKVQNSGIIKEVRDRRYYEKPSETRKIAKKVAKKRLKKQIEASKPKK